MLQGSGACLCPYSRTDLLLFWGDLKPCHSVWDWVSLCTKGADGVRPSKLANNEALTRRLASTIIFRNPFFCSYGPSASVCPQCRDERRFTGSQAGPQGGVVHAAAPTPAGGAVRRRGMLHAARAWLARAAVQAGHAAPTRAGMHVRSVASFTRSSRVH